MKKIKTQNHTNLDLKAKIKNINKDILQENNSSFLDVEFEIIDSNNKTIITRKLGFPLEIDPKEIEGEIKQYVKVYQEDLVLAERSKKIEVANKRADETIDSLVGKTL